MIPGVIIKESDESKQDLVDRLVDAYNSSGFTAVNAGSIAGKRSQKSYILYLCKTSNLICKRIRQFRISEDEVV